MPDKALLMGINEYKSVPGLHGCLADVESMRGLLVDVFGFPPEQVKMLTDEEVTKDRVEEWIGWLFQGTGAGDRLVLHFSGHGSYTADRDADESDKVDELICLHDMDWERPGSYLVDDELYELLGRVPPEAQMLVVLDNCHSGTGTRTITPAELEILGSGARGLRSAKTFPLVVEHSTAQRRLARSVLSTGTSRSAAGLGDEAAQPTDIVLARFVPPPPEVKRRARSLLQVRPQAGEECEGVEPCVAGRLSG